MEFLYPANHIKCISKIINNASSYLVICCPFWWRTPKDVYDYQQMDIDYRLISDILHPILRLANKNVPVILFCRSKYEDVLSKFFNNEISQGRILLCTNEEFHCKLYFNEKNAIITSKNLSNDQSKDFGVIFEDSSKVEELGRFVLTLISDYDLKKKIKALLKL